MEQNKAKAETNHPVEDIFGEEILMDDVYFKFGQDIVLEKNLKLYLISKQSVDCYRAS